MSNNDILWHKKPAAYWEAALPLGNGHLGAMVYGGVEREEYQLNHDQLWSGPGEYEFNPETPKLVEDARQLIREEKYTEAVRFIDENILHERDECQAYQTAGSLFLDFELPSDNVTNYRRDLSLSAGMTTVCFDCDGITYSRETFVSYPAQVMCVSLACSEAGGLSFSAHMTSPMQHFVASQATADTIAYDGRCASMNPAARQGYTEDDVWAEEKRKSPAVRYQNRLFAVAKGANAVTEAEDGMLRVTGADEITLYIAIATDFCGHDRQPGSDGVKPGKKAEKLIRSAAGRGWSALQEEHRLDHAALYDRVQLRLGRGSGSDVSIEERLRANPSPEQDQDLVSLLFQYGRYLLIACSRAGCEPSNLQGIWNDKVSPPWSGRYTININTEMNYWPAQTCNLSECDQPMLDMVCELAKSGKRAASELYGCRGSCSHHNTDLWRWPGYVGFETRWAFWPMSLGWLSRHLWESYLFSGDKAFLKERAFPVLKSCALFYLDYLVENKAGMLVTSPATSPENSFIDPGTGEKVEASEGSAMDQSIVREVFVNTISAAAHLGMTDDAVIEEIAGKLSRLAPHTVGSEGQLLEYLEDFEEAEPTHRHVSHLYDVYPGCGFTPEKDQALINAVRRSLIRRGDKTTGWGMGWRTCLWARMRDGDHALEVLRQLMILKEPEVKSRGGGLYLNFFDAHPPFQIDGNFGATAGVAELFLQSHWGSLDILPALPTAWAEGEVKGLCARGGFEVDIAWAGGALTEARIKAGRVGKVQVRYGEQRAELELTAGQIVKLDEQLVAS